MFPLYFSKYPKYYIKIKMLIAQTGEGILFTFAQSLIQMFDNDFRTKMWEIVKEILLCRFLAIQTSDFPFNVGATGCCCRHCRRTHKAAIERTSTAIERYYSQWKYSMGDGKEKEK